MVTFKQAVERYVQAKARKKSLTHDRLYLRQLQAALGAETPLTELTAARISAWQDAQLTATCPRTGRPYAPASVNRPLAALRTLLTLAHERWGWLSAVPRIELAKEPEGRVRYLEADEEARLLAAARESKNPELVPAIIVSMETGLRRGELLGLNWADVDMTRGLIRLDGRRTKSGKRREVPMRQEVYAALSNLPGEREGRVFKTRSLRTAFERAVNRAGIQDFHWHDLRHHFASWFVMRGGTLQALKEVLGHADLKMTLRYAHLSPDHLRDQMTRTARPDHSRTAAEQLTQDAAAAEVTVEGERNVR